MTKTAEKQAPENDARAERAAADSEKFEAWAIVELMGHRKIAGRVSEQIIAGAPLLRIDVPEVPAQAAFTTFYGPHTIYSLTPTTEEIAKRLAYAMRAMPIDPYEIRQLPAPRVTDAEIEEDE
jgi:hypothetical protein